MNLKASWDYWIGNTKDAKERVETTLALKQ